MEISIRDDFCLEKITNSGQCFRARQLEEGWFRFITGRALLLIRQSRPGVFEARCSEAEWQAVWAGYFDLGRNYAAIRRGIPQEDAWMRRAAAEGCGVRILRQDPWETLVTFILSQRKSIPAIRQAVELLCERYGEPIAAGGPRAFPTPAALAAADEAGLAACKPGYRAPYIRAAAERVSSGGADLAGLASLPDETLLSALKGFYGVGEKVARCTALFAYGRLGLAPVDTWIQKVIARAYGGRDPFLQYGPAAGVLQQYAFYYAQNHKAELCGRSAEGACS